jgi:hypothetical protein
MVASETRKITEEIRALSVGPAAALSLSADAPVLRVHGVFAAAVNLEVEGTRRFVSLCGPSGRDFPGAVVLARPGDFRSWRLDAGRPARYADGSLHLHAEAGPVVVDMRQAERPPSIGLPLIRGRGATHRACQVRLAALQDDARCDLRLGAPWRAGGPTTALGARLGNAAAALGTAARAVAASSSRGAAAGGRSGPDQENHHRMLAKAVADLVGLGAGLTPSGDDFLCGFMAAARGSALGPYQAGRERAGVGEAGRPGLLEALHDAAARCLGRTSSLSAFLIRCAIENLWPRPLNRLAEGLAGERETEALTALADLCRLGHSSGCDIATGFLFGLESIGLDVPLGEGRG